MKITKFAVERPIATIMFFTLMLLFGFISFFKLPIDFMPKIEAPVISIITFWPGSSTEDVETKVTKIIETNLNIINNLDSIKSSTKEGVSIVNCVFEQGIDLTEASNDIRDRLEFAKAYMPSDAKDPIIFKFNTAMMPMIFYGITAKENLENLYDIVQDEIARPLQRLPGVGGVQVIGGMQRQINVKLRREKLFAYNLSIHEIQNALNTQNLSLPAGMIKINDVDYLLRIPGEYTTLDDIKNVIIKRVDDKIVKLSEVCHIEDNFKEENYHVLVNDSKAIMLMVQKRAEANTVEVANLVQEEMKSLFNNLPPDIKPSLIMDSSEFIKSSVGNLKNTALWAIFFVSIITYFFFRSIRASAIIILTIPCSIIIAFVFMHVQKWTINIMSLAAIAIAVGMVVDNAVVILDSIMNHQKKKDIKTSAILASNEVGMAIGASTLTTIVIFLPLIFLKGIVGIMFKQLGGVIAITLLASLLSALMLTPMMASKLLKNMPKMKNPKIFQKLEKVYISILSYALSHRKKVVIISISTFVISLLLLPFIGSEFMPQEDSGDITVTIHMPLGTNVDKTFSICEKVSYDIKQIIGDKHLIHSYFRCGAEDSGLGAAFNRDEASHVGQIGFKLVKQKYRDFSSKDIAKKISEKLKEIDEIEKLDIDDADPMNKHMFGSSKPISIEVLGHDLLKTQQIAEEIKEISLNIKGAKDVFIDRDLGKPELVINIDKQKALMHGLDMTTIATTLRSLYHGTNASKYHDNGHDYNIFLRLDPLQRQNLSDISSTIIKTPYLQNVFLNDIATISEKLGPVTIDRQNAQRVVKVNMDVNGRSQGEILKDLKSKIKDIVLPADIEIQMGGLAKEQVKAFKTLMLMFILGILLVYMVMAAQFESLKHPFIIMFSIPFALVGVFLALFITRTTLNAMSFIGIVMLVGIVVNNAIVLIDYINEVRKEKINLNKAILKAGKHRLRPVLITTLTTVFGMFSLILSVGEGAQMWRPLGITVIGGMLVSTLVTLVLVPTLYFIFENKKENKLRKSKN
ncbi:MAG: Cobalt-zinc-cadmium resistance protein CzcA [Candidatus Anoxychlamydiales bacterium]|nr:Cobalt-zinc-cadmium resistance protein CzcA [Candidatus Anoxychlamydiales bacterium]